MIFVDASYFLALVNREDPYHEEAVTMLATRVGPELWVTTHLELGTLWDVLAPRIGAFEASQAIRIAASSPQIRVMPVTGAQQAEAFGLLRRRLSYTDATSITVMRALRVRQLLTFVAAFAEVGLDPIRD